MAKNTAPIVILFLLMLLFGVLLIFSIKNLSEKKPIEKETDELKPTQFYENDYTDYYSSLVAQHNGDDREDDDTGDDGDGDDDDDG